MSDAFGSTYAAAYDVIYRDKDYAAECALIDRVLHDHGEGAVRRVLDLGCGTGNHAIPLAERGYEVVGVDRSGGMLAQAREKARVFDRASPRVTFHQGDVRTVALSQEFDAVLMMFAVLGYQLENTDVLAALRTARRHLRPGGLFVYDVWYGPAVLAERPSQRLKTIATERGQILRAASGELDTRRHRCAVRFQVWRLEGDRLEAYTDETHLMRYFFPLELDLVLGSSGLTPVRLGAFPDVDRDPDDTTWNVLGVARAV